MPLRAFLEGQGIISLEYSDDQWTEIKSKIKKEKIPLTRSEKYGKNTHLRARHGNVARLTGLGESLIP